MGFSHTAVFDRVQNGRLHPMYRGVYAVGHAKPPLEGCFLAAVKACRPGALLSHHAAAAHWDYLPWDGRDPEVTVTAQPPEATGASGSTAPSSSMPGIDATTEASPSPHRPAPSSTSLAPGSPTRSCAAPFARGWPPSG